MKGPLIGDDRYGDENAAEVDAAVIAERGIGEFRLIDRLAAFGVAENLKNAESVLIGIGDDAAVVSTPAGEQLLTTDAIVDGVHFRSVDARWHDIGWKCAVSNLSDIAAMGGAPDHALVTVGVPEGTPAETFTDLYAGINEAFVQFGGRVVGGDVVSSPTMFINLALTGHPSRTRDGASVWLRRDAARAGDLVCVTGPLGGSAGGLEVLLAGDADPSGQILVDRHFRPTPRLEAGVLLVESGVLCAMDVSDGLVGDLEKLAGASAVGIAVEMADVPMPAELKLVFGARAIDLALGGGEDYELVFTAPESIISSVLGDLGPDACVIGRVVESGIAPGEVKVFDAAGAQYEPPRKGWDHLDG
ncbi:MAG: thiamine-phosphate kinase [Chloroflexi bacterium]|nr:thiamine-phosphate kinase [Chloroflexota bacterium]